MTNIEWTDRTWNPTTGCTKISAGCRNCYAEKMTRRLKAMGREKYRAGFDTVQLHPRVLEMPKKWKKPSRIFVNSMSDLFHADIPLSFIQRVFQVMNECPRHIFQVLTKRADRLEKLSNQLHWSDNIWMGTTIENRKSLSRLDHLKNCQADIKFLCLEPLLEALPDIDLAGIDWVLVGGESGAGSRPVDPDWVREIRDACLNTQTLFYFLNWGGFNKKKNGRLLDGRTWDETPHQRFGRTAEHR